ncbi:avidin/streptavidin family protein [Streptomyces sp. NBC_00879]|uniref:avidin/streptavidin family protein n=1 Tax=Streptomyces sp. NBC_00879 TaxID=2975855 RepID=UPI00386736F1|nr:avidin/streptavidin family protein [Streptomyces sp. NBC_00879]
MSIAGDWYNEFGSHMEITPGPSGEITGTFASNTGLAAGEYALVGRYDTLERADHGTAIGWTVAWRNERHNANCVTSWSGLCFADDDTDRICATWLLTTSATTSDAWESTTVGWDVFTRESPGPGRIEDTVRSTGPTSHPTATGGHHSR